MNGIYYYVIAFFVIWTVALIFNNRLSTHGFSIEFPVIMWRTDKLRGLISRIANISPRFWKYFMTVGIFVAFGAMIAMAWLLVSSLETISTTPSVSLVIPGVEMPGSSIYVPLGYGLIGLATVLIVHEFSHGILAVSEKINIKSIGLLLFAIIPGAFVEPDEEELKASSKLSQLRVYAAGSIANMSLAAIALVLFLVISSYAIPANFSENGIEINRVVSDSPASQYLKEVEAFLNNQLIKMDTDVLLTLTKCVIINGMNKNYIVTVENAVSNAYTLFFKRKITFEEQKKSVNEAQILIGEINKILEVNGFTRT